MIQLTDKEIDELAELIQIAWRKYRNNFGVDPHGTLSQIKAMLCFLPKEDGTTYIRLVRESE